MLKGIMPMPSFCEFPIAKVVILMSKKIKGGGYKEMINVKSEGDKHCLWMLRGPTKKNWLINNKTNMDYTLWWKWGNTMRNEYSR